MAHILVRDDGSFSLIFQSLTLMLIIQGGPKVALPQ